jgi:low temperature requirement protein LtrA
VADTVAAGKKADAGKKVLIARFHLYAHVPLTCCFALQPLVLKFGINHITDLVENRTAKLVRCSSCFSIMFPAPHLLMPCVFNACLCARSLFRIIFLSFCTQRASPAIVLHTLDPLFAPCF